MSFTITINNLLVKTMPNISVLQACENANVVVPRFCYHPRLSAAGNCRLCLVEIDKMPKLQASCAISVLEGMVIKTNTLAVKKARENILEFLLINHPLDCPICDQGGECDLQDQSLIYGSDKSRFKEFKRAVEDKNCGPLIKTIMTRCINCTRCIRFINEIIGTPVLGSIGRSNSIEISTYLNKYIFSEMSANIVDLCPVGALLPKPLSSSYRPWELKHIESVDPFDSIHSNLQLSIRGYDVLRVLPRLNEDINEEWVSDKARFAFDGFTIQRLNIPLLKENNKFKTISWADAIKLTTNALSYNLNSVCFSIGTFSDFNSLFALKLFSSILNGFVLDNFFNFIFNKDFQVFYKFNTLIKNIFEADVCLLVGLNPRIDVPLLNYHLRKRYMLGNFILANIGSKINLSFPCIHIGNSMHKLFHFLEGNNFFCKIFRNSKKPCLIINPAILQSLDFDFTIFLSKSLIANSNLTNNLWNGLNSLYVKSNYYSKFDLSYNTYYEFDGNLCKMLYVLEDYNAAYAISNFEFIIYQGNQGNYIAQVANIILPNLSFLEKNSIYVNCEGRYQHTQSAMLNINKSNSDFSIFHSLLKPLYVNSFDIDLNLFLPTINFLTNRVFYCFFKDIFFCNSFFLVPICYISSTTIDNFYKTDSVSNLSLTMSKCSTYLLDKNPFK